LVTNEQLYIAVGIPMLFNAALIGFVIATINARFGKVETKFEGIDKRFDAIDPALRRHSSPLARRAPTGGRSARCPFEAY
jgi:hypothetical protein